MTSDKIMIPNTRNRSINKIYTYQPISRLDQVNKVITLLIKLLIIFIIYVLYIRIQAFDIKNILEEMNSNNITIVENSDIAKWYNWHYDL